ncbi:FAD-dependent oxidoreductase [Priestia megaterium]|nr:FAD-dependent oxidoreductase [Priestia megaterium]
MNRPHIVILGAGYGGLMTATRLQKKIGTDEVDITLINKNDYHYETTWLHEASAGTLHHDKVRYDIQSLLNKQKIHFVQDTVTRVNAKTKEVLLEGTTLTYDYLVIALGGEPETFGIQGLSEYAFSITNVQTARKIYQHLNYEFAKFTEEGPTSKDLLTIVVGGGGFTGIEFLGELTNKIPHLCKEHDVNPTQVRIICVEASPTILPGFDPELVSYAVDVLQSKGVEFKTGTAIKQCTKDGITIAQGEQESFISSKVVIWAAGVRGSSIIDASEFESIRGKIKVDEYLRSPEYTDVFIIGDCSLVFGKDSERPYPPTAQIAMQQGEHVANTLQQLIRGNEQLIPFVFDNKGTVCSLGHKDAIGVVYGKKLKGKPASMMKKVIDNRSLFLIGGLPLVFKKGKFF